MSIASELQDKIDAKAAIKASIEAKGVAVGNVKLNQYASKVDAIAQDPTIPVGVGQHLVTFYDFDGKVLKRQRVNTGEDATAPAIPTHQYLTFAEWNNPFTNVQSDIDAGAICNTTDGKTYLFITLTAVTGLAPTLYFSKSSTSLMTINWGDGTTSTSTTSGNQSINHVYATAGDYIITVDNSAGGTWVIGQGTSTTKLFQGYENILTKIYLGLNISLINANALQLARSLNFITLPNYNIDFGSYAFMDASLIHINIYNQSFSGQLSQFTKNYLLKSFASKNNIGYNSSFTQCYGLEKVKINITQLISAPFYWGYGLKKVHIGSALISIGDSSFYQCYSITEYVFLSTTPPTLANINAFTGINPICKIYVPDVSVDAYKAATNWITYANYIYPLSQKPQSNE